MNARRQTSRARSLTSCERAETRKTQVRGGRSIYRRPKGQLRAKRAMCIPWPIIGHNSIITSYVRVHRGVCALIAAPAERHQILLRYVLATGDTTVGRAVCGRRTDYCPARGDAAAHEQTSAAWERRGRFRRWDAIRATTSLKSRNDQAEGTTHLPCQENYVGSDLTDNNPM